MQDAEVVNETEPEVINAELVPTRDVDEVQVWVETARQHRRSIDAAIRYATSLATYSKEVAECMEYIILRGKTEVRGPSIRAAEVMAAGWGNLRIITSIREVTERWVTVVGTACDMETNNVVSLPVRRRLTQRDGRPYTEDMRQVAIAAAIAIARRNAILAVIPRVYVDIVLSSARKVAAGDKRPLSEQRAAVLKWFESRVPLQRIYEVLGVSGPEDITLEHMERLRGLKVAIDEMGVDAVFPPTNQANDALPLSDIISAAVEQAAKNVSSDEA